MSSEIATPPVLTRRAPQRQRGRDRVAGLMAAAAALFVEKGYVATTMTEIAARAGASIGSLYLFFPTKAALAQSMATALADALSAQLDALRCRVEGWHGAVIADALFEELSQFLAEHPVYAVLVDLPGDDGWKQAVRVLRRAQIADLFAHACPLLPPGQAERLAIIVPQLMRIPMTVGQDGAPSRDAIVSELRDMLRHHLK
jgi:AcrR family transcriptional regulator